MAYHALWLRGNEVVADESFADLLKAKQHVLAHLDAIRRKDGVTSVKVIGNGRTCFMIEK